MKNIIFFFILNKLIIGDRCRDWELKKILREQFRSWFDRSSRSIVAYRKYISSCILAHSVTYTHARTHTHTHTCIQDVTKHTRYFRKINFKHQMKYKSWRVKKILIGVYFVINYLIFHYMKWARIKLKWLFGIVIWKINSNWYFCISFFVLTFSFLSIIDSINVSHIFF